MLTFIKFLKTLTNPQRVAASFIIAALCGSTLLDILAEYATYAYAINRGVRAPAEGVEFLKDSIPLLSFALMVGVTVAFYLARASFRWLFGHVHNSVFGYAGLPAQIRNLFRAPGAQPDNVDRTLKAISDAPREFGRASGTQAAVVVAAVAAAMGTLIYWIAVWNGVDYPFDQGAVVGVFVLAAGLSLWREWVLVLMAAATALSVYAFAVLAALDAESVGKFLKSTQYGGGLSACVEMIDRPAVIEMRLEIRTQRALLGFDRVDGNPLDIPLAQIKSIKIRKYSSPEDSTSPESGRESTPTTTCD